MQLCKNRPQPFSLDDISFVAYLEEATFDADGKFRGCTDLTDHDRGDHHNPHYHPATGPSSRNERNKD